MMDGVTVRDLGVWVACFLAALPGIRWLVSMGRGGSEKRSISSEDGKAVEVRIKRDLAERFAPVEHEHPCYAATNHEHPDLINIHQYKEEHQNVTDKMEENRTIMTNKMDAIEKVHAARTEALRLEIKGDIAAVYTTIRQGAESTNKRIETNSERVGELIGELRRIGAVQ